MPTLPVRLHPDAVDEAAEAAQWYRQRSAQATAAFMAALDHAIEQIGEAPERWPAHLHGTRRFVLRRFPFSIVYRRHEDFVEVVAVAHAKRRPGYWRGR
jgi:plasmid stabilization system protein ParE